MPKVVCSAESIGPSKVYPVRIAKTIEQSRNGIGCLLDNKPAGGAFQSPAAVCVCRRALELETVEGGAESGIPGWAWGHDLSESWTEQPCIRSGEEQCNAQACRSNVCFRQECLKGGASSQRGVGQVLRRYLSLPRRARGLRDETARL